MLQTNNKVAAEFTDTTVLISDMPDFVTINVHSKACDIVHVMSDLFSRFDRLVDIHQVINILF
jgi:hypothetical protein